MAYKPNIPQSTDNLSQSQIDMLGNFQQLNTSFLVDHYTFADLTANNGKHNTVTTPAYVAAPPTGLAPTTNANEPRFYAFQDYAAIGTIQYSRGGSNAIPSPITFLQSPSSPIIMNPGDTTNVIDFTGTTRVLAKLYIYGNFVGNPTLPIGLPCEAYIWSVGGTIAINYYRSLLVPATTALQYTAYPVNTGSILQIKYDNIAAGDIFWTLQFLRIQ